MQFWPIHMEDEAQEIQLNQNIHLMSILIF